MRMLEVNKMHIYKRGVKWLLTGFLREGSVKDTARIMQWRKEFDSWDEALAYAVKMVVERKLPGPASIVYPTPYLTYLHGE